VIRGVAFGVIAFAALAGTGVCGFPAETPEKLLDRVEEVWHGRDLAAYLALWDSLGPEGLTAERAFVLGHFQEGSTEIRFQRPQGKGVSTPLKVIAQIFSLTEPRGRAEQWLFTLKSGAGGWFLAGRAFEGDLTGLIHLSLSSEGIRADGLVLQLEDFELKMVHGTLFVSPASIGPTLLLFVGEGLVRVSPQPATERDQLRQFCGKEELVDRVRLAFVRLHPADLHRVLAPVRLDPDPSAGRRLAEAQKFYKESVERSFVVDAPLPYSPWWLIPPVGDSWIAFDTKRFGRLTFAVSQSEFEGISLFDRARHRQICLYPARGRDTRYNEDSGRFADVLSHDLRVRFDPARRGLKAQDTLRIRLLAPSSTLRLRLDDALHVESVTSEAGALLFFRVKDQDALIISLGPLVGTLGEVSLTIHYEGVLLPGPVEREVLQTVDRSFPGATDLNQEVRGEHDVSEGDIPIEPVFVYNNRTPWYPQAPTDSYARSKVRLTVPSGLDAVTGGLRTVIPTESARVVSEYRQDLPGRYISVVVGRLTDVATEREGPVTIHGFAVPRTRTQVVRMLDRARAILRFYSNEFGPCPYPALNLVHIEDLTPGGHSPPGMVLIAERPRLLKGTLREDPANFSDVPDFFLAHELAHQWWGHGVAGQNYHERWLSEGTAQYAAALWVRESQGEGAFRNLLKRMGRWAMRYTQEGAIHLGHRLGHVKGDPQIYRAVVYDKGAYILHMLRGIVGSEVFREALKAFLASHRFQKTGSDDLREALERASGKDLRPYFESWVFGTSVPALALSHRSASRGSGGYTTLVSVKAKNLPGPVPLEIVVIHEGGRQKSRVQLPPEGATFAVLTEGRPGKVEINTDLGLLARLDRS